MPFLLYQNFILSYNISMTQTHNLDYYQSFLKKYTDYQATYDNQKGANYCLNPLLYPAHQVSNYLNGKISSETLKSAYFKTGNLAVRLSGMFSLSLSKRIEEAWQDPISTKTLLNSAVRVRNYFKPWAQRKPSQLPLIGRVDRGFVAFSQHIHTLSKDVVTILSFPDKLHAFLDFGKKEEVKKATEPESTPTTHPTTTAIPSRTERVWEVISAGMNSIKNFITEAVLWIIRQIGSLLRKVTFLEPAIEKIEELDIKPHIEKIVDKLNPMLIQKAQDLIRAKEDVIRKKALATTAELVARKALVFTVNMTIMATLSCVIYCISGYLPIGEIDRYSTIRSGGALALWGWSVVPIVKELPEDYKEKFDPEASTFNELKTLITIQNIHKLIIFLKNI